MSECSVCGGTGRAFTDNDCFGGGGCQSCCPKVYGVGPPRSGTTMLARCLSIVRETHHQCGTKDAADLVPFTAANNACAEGEDIDITPFLGGHANEVAYWFTFMAPRLDGKIIHLWRPPEIWVRSAQVIGLLGGTKSNFYNSLIGRPQGSELTEDDWETYLLRFWRTNHQAVLARTDSYVIRPEWIEWRHLLDWLGWDYTDEQITRIEDLQRTKPNRSSSRENLLLLPPERIPDEVREVEAELVSRSQRTVKPIHYRNPLEGLL